MPGVTLTGGAGETVTLPFPPGPNAVLAQFLADQLTADVKNGSLTAVDYTGLPSPPVPPGTDEEVIIKANGPLVLAHTATAVVDAAHSSILFGGGAPNETVLSGSGNLTFFTDGGSGTFVAGSGNTTFVQTGSGPWDIHTGGGNDRILISGGTNTISAGTGHNSILLGGGNNLVNSTGKDVIEAVSGSDTITASGDAQVKVQGVKANITFIGGDQSATVLGGAGSETVFASAGGYFRGGTAGNNLIYGGDGATTIMGDGATTIMGGGNGDRLYATGDDKTQIFAAGGNETLDASLATGNDALHAGSGNDELIGGFGNDTLTAATGSVTMQGGAGKDVFQFIKGDATQATITDFSSLEGDKVDLTGYGHNEVNYALQHAQVSAAGTTITLTDNTKITFASVTDLSKTSFT